MKKPFIFGSLFAFMCAPAFAQVAGTCPELSPLQQAVGVIDSPGALLFIGAALLLVGTGFVLSRLLDFEWMRAEVWGVLGCLIGGALMTYGLWAGPSFTSVVPVSVATIIGAIIVAPSLFLILIEVEGGGEYGYFGILAVVYAAFAAWRLDPVVATFALIAVLGLVGFTGAGGGLSYVVGFSDDRRIPGATLAATLMAAAGVAVSWFDVSIPSIAVFAGGATWVGMLGAGLGVLIISSKWYGTNSDESNRWSTYLFHQIIAMAVIGGGLYAGVLLNNSGLLYVSAAFLLLFAIEKLYEATPQSRLAYGLVTVAIGAAAIYGGNWLSANMDAVQGFIASLRVV